MLHVVTDVLDLDISLKGGEIDRADLRQYPLHKDMPNIPVRLESRDPNSLYLLQTGLIGAAGRERADAPRDLDVGRELLRAPRRRQRIAACRSTWTDGQGLTVTKTFVFTRGWYAIDLSYEVKNDRRRPRRVSPPTARSCSHWEHASRSYFDVETYSFKGPAVFDGEIPRPQGRE